MEIQSIKQRFGIIGNSPLLNQAITVAAQVAPTDLTILITGESGVGKEIFPQIIHQLSARKHGPYIAVNCGAIPEGTIDSELFGHEKGSFTGATDARKGYFEVVDKGTIFLDEVAELPLATQARLLRVLESGEFIKVGSSKTQKTDVRVVAATNVDIHDAISRGKFRQDLYYRLNTVPIHVPPLRERGEDILLLFRKFASDFAEKYRMPAIELSKSAQQVALAYRWDGNVRQLKNMVGQISIIEQQREIDEQTLRKYLPHASESGLSVVSAKSAPSDFYERDLLYNLLFDMRREIKEMKLLLSGNGNNETQLYTAGNAPMVDYKPLPYNSDPLITEPEFEDVTLTDESLSDEEGKTPKPAEDESLSLSKMEKEMIIKALKKHNNRKGAAAEDLGIAYRTLYRKIQEYGIE